MTTIDREHAELAAAIVMTLAEESAAREATVLVVPAKLFTDWHKMVKAKQ